MKKLLLAALLLLGLNACARKPAGGTLPFFGADNPKIQYTGRVDFTDAKRPQFWAPGVYITARFEGPYCEVKLTDEVRSDTNQNYVDISVDGVRQRRKLTDSTNTLLVADGLGKGPHTLVITKDTEAGIGYLRFEGLRCEKLLPPPPRPKRRIEFIGNSITCGMGNDVEVMPCGTGQWYDQHNAYLAYGPRTARALDAEWQLSSVSGIGLIHSCCGHTKLMPDVFAQTNLEPKGPRWDFARYQPDVVTVCLGQNDGIQDSTAFCGAYVRFLGTLRQAYPKAKLICMNSPMGNAELTAVLRRYITGVVAATRAGGDANVDSFFFPGGYNGGCGAHPNMPEHELTATALTAYLRKTMGW